MIGNFCKFVAKFNVLITINHFNQFQKYKMLMKNLFTLALAALIAAPTMSANIRLPHNHAAMSAGAVSEINPAMLGKNAAAVSLKSVKSRADESLITDPEGEAKYYDRTTLGYTVIDYESTWGEFYYGAKVVYGDNNEVYIDNPIPGLPFGAYLKATKDGDKITAQLPQLIGEYDYWGSIIYYYASLMKFDPAKGYVAVDDADNVITWTVAEDGSFSFDLTSGEIEIDPETGEPVEKPECGFGSYLKFGVDGEATFANTIDFKQTLVPVDVEAQTSHAPDGLSFEQWTFSCEGGAPRMVNVGIAGNEIYVSNITDYAPEAVIKGTVEGDKASFATGQYLGYLGDYSYFIYFMSAKADDSSEIMEFMLNNALVFDYDANGKALTSKADDVMLINANNKNVYWIEYALEPVIKWYDPADLNAAPNAPSLLDYQAYEGYCCGIWKIPATNVNGATLDPSRMSYNLFMDGEIYTFYTDMYYGLPEDMTYIPYNFTDDYDILVDGEVRTIYMYDSGFTTLGIQSHFEGYDGKTYSSEIKTYDITTGLSNVESSKTVKQVEFFNLAGAKVENPTHGLYIQRATYTDGTSTSAKIAIR